MPGHSLPIEHSRRQLGSLRIAGVVAGTQDSEPQGSANKLQLTEKTSGQQPGKPDTDLSDDHAQTGSSSTAPSHQLSDISLAEAHSPVAQRPAKDQLISRGHQQRGAVSADIVHRKHGSGSSETHADVESYDLAAKIPAAHHLRALSAGQPHDCWQDSCTLLHDQTFCQKGIVLDQSLPGSLLDILLELL